jgi:hypothetical protein
VRIMKYPDEIAAELMNLSGKDLHIFLSLSGLYLKEYKWYGSGTYSGKHPITGEESSYVHLLSSNNGAFKAAVEEGQEFALRRVKEYLDSRKNTLSNLITQNV